MSEGRAAFVYQDETHETYYKVFGDLKERTRTPVVVLHGGPGLTHDYLLPHTDLVEQSFPVIFYDQIGNGRSTRLPHKPQSFWAIDFFVDELVNLLAHLGIQDDFHIVGHSWGGMLAAEFVVRRHPKGLRRLVIADSPADMVAWDASSQKLMDTLPQWVKDAFARGVDADREGYWNAMMAFYALYGCRVKPFPQELIDTLLYKYGENGDRTVDKLHVLKDWSIVDRLHSVDVPVLVINGKYDIAQDEVVEPYVKRIPGAKWIRFEESSHTPCWEERTEYMKAVGEFLGAL